MVDIWMDVDAAISEAPINIISLIDDTDFKTREESVTYDQAGIDLVWNFVTTAGAFTQTSVTPTTGGGDYDWTNQGNGMYTIEIPAAGGASINNDTEGHGWFTGYATGILPWRGPIIGFRAAALNNALIDGGDNLDVNTVQWLGQAVTLSTGNKPDVNIDEISDDATAASNFELALENGTAGYIASDLKYLDGTAQSATDLKDFADTGYDPAAHKVQGVVLTDTCTTNTDLVTAANVVDEWETQSQADPTGFHVNVLEIGGTAQTANDNGADINAILTDTNELQTDWTNGGRLDLILDAILALLDDARGEPGDVAPPVNPDAMTKIDYLYKFLRNKIETTATKIHIYDDAGTNKDHTATISDDGTTFTRGEFVIGDA